MTRAILAGLIIVAAAALFLVSPVLAAQCSGTVGKASFYSDAHHGRTTASGEPFNMNALTAAMPSRKHLGQRYRVTAGNRSVEVRINDVGPAKRLNRVIDLSRASFEKLAPLRQGIVRVCLERVR